MKIFNMIDYTKINQQRETVKAQRYTITAARFINPEIADELEFQIGEFHPNEVITIPTDKRWSLHDLIVHSIKQCGPSEIFIATYAIKEYQARLLANMKADGLLKKIYCYLDYRVDKHDPNALQIINTIAESVKFTRLHGKVTVLIGEKNSCTIIGSANLTTNTTSDTIAIIVNQPTSIYWKEWIIKNMNYETK